MGVRGLAPALSEASCREGSAVHTQGVHTQGGAHTRRCTHEVVCGHRMSFVI